MGSAPSDVRADTARENRTQLTGWRRIRRNRRMTSGINCCLQFGIKAGLLAPFAAGLFVAAASSAGIAQTAAEHEQHHPGNAPAATVQSNGATSHTAAGGGGMAGMESMHGGGEHSSYSAPLYPRMLQLDPGDQTGRRALRSEAEQRAALAAAAIRTAGADVASTTTGEARAEAVDRLRTATAEYQAAQRVAAALRSDGEAQSEALDWYQTAMNLGSSPHTEERGIFGLSALHLFLMTIGGILAAGLLALQLLRLRRGQALIDELRTGAPATASEEPAQAQSQRASASFIPAGSTAAPPVGRRATDNGKRRWSGELRVAHIVNETPTVETYRLVPMGSDELPFDFLPGQFLQVEVEPEPDKRFRRSYTIASSPTQRAFVEITVKREDQGVVSRHLNEKLEVGDLLRVSGPFGSFTFTGSDAQSVVLIAGGVGITPVMSVLRYLTDKAWPGDIFLLYGAKSTEEFLFREEIERLEKRHANLHVLATMQRSPGTVWLGPEGILTKELIASAVPRIAERRIHLCGPPPMMAAVQKLLVELGVPEAQIHSEAFGPASLPAENAPSALTIATEQSQVTPAGSQPSSTAIPQTTVTFSLSGVAAPLRADESVLEAAEGAGVEIPYVCRIGECGVCVTKLLQGSVTMAVEKGLDPADKAQGYVLACQAKTTGSPLIVEA